MNKMLIEIKQQESLQVTIKNKKEQKKFIEKKLKNWCPGELLKC